MRAVVFRDSSREGDIDPVIRAAREGRNSIPRRGGRPIYPTVAVEAAPAPPADPEIAAWLAEHEATHLPARKTSAPSIVKIRAALARGGAVSFVRDGRTITFTTVGQETHQVTASERWDSQAAGEHLRAAAPSRSRRRRAQRMAAVLGKKQPA